MIERHSMTVYHVAVGLDLGPDASQAAAAAATHRSWTVPILGDRDWNTIAVHLLAERCEVIDKIATVDAVADGLGAEFRAVKYVRGDSFVLAFHDAVDRGLGLLSDALVLIIC